MLSSRCLTVSLCVLEMIGLIQKWRETCLNQNSVNNSLQIPSKESVYWEVEFCSVSLRPFIRSIWTLSYIRPHWTPHFPSQKDAEVLLIIFSF